MSQTIEQLVEGVRAGALKIKLFEHACFLGPEYQGTRDVRVTFEDGTKRRLSPGEYQILRTARIEALRKNEPQIKR